ncbi:unnamed protein product [Periconia digitata]|uniref:Sm protein F n=1 Tax=Periconia digitata TaxID=1303443 RepID=A0A9W4U3F9_9PLEO|nr:unnamed protein product [Periconia digitata]
MSAVAPFNPRPLLQSLVDKDIVVRLKWGETEYKGRLVSVDLYMNIQLNNTEEFIGGQSSGQLGQVLIRYVSLTRDEINGWRKEGNGEHIMDGS